MQHETLDAAEVTSAWYAMRQRTNHARAPCEGEDATTMHRDVEPIAIALTDLLSPIAYSTTQHASMDAQTTTSY